MKVLFFKKKKILLKYKTVKETKIEGRAIWQKDRASSKRYGKNQPLYLSIVNE